jgi:hypothetical protein
MRYGLPAWALLVALMLGLVYAAGRRKDLPESWKRARHAWAFTLFGITVAAATVHLWNALFVLFLFLIGSGSWLYDTKVAAQKPPARLSERIGGPLRMDRSAPRLRPSPGRLF